MTESSGKYSRPDSIGSTANDVSSRKRSTSDPIEDIKKFEFKLSKTSVGYGKEDDGVSFNRNFGMKTSPGVCKEENFVSLNTTVEFEAMINDKRSVNKISFESQNLSDDEASKISDDKESRVKTECNMQSIKENVHSVLNATHPIQVLSNAEEAVDTVQDDIQSPTSLCTNCRFDIQWHCGSDDTELSRKSSGISRKSAQRSYEAHSEPMFAEPEHFAQPENATDVVVETTTTVGNSSLLLNSNHVIENLLSLLKPCEDLRLGLVGQAPSVENCFSESEGNVQEINKIGVTKTKFQGETPKDFCQDESEDTQNRGLSRNQNKVLGHEAAEILQTDTSSGGDTSSTHTTVEEIHYMAENENTNIEFDEPSFDLTESQFERIEQEALMKFQNVPPTDSTENAKEDVRASKNLNVANTVETEPVVFYQPDPSNRSPLQTQDFVLPRWVTNPAAEPDYNKISRTVLQRRQCVRDMLQQIVKLSTYVVNVRKALLPNDTNNNLASTNTLMSESTSRPTYGNQNITLINRNSNVPTKILGFQNVQSCGYNKNDDKTAAQNVFYTQNGRSISNDIFFRNVNSKPKENNTSINNMNKTQCSRMYNYNPLRSNNPNTRGVPLVVQNTRQNINNEQNKNYQGSVDFKRGNVNSIPDHKVQQIQTTIQNRGRGRVVSSDVRPGTSGIDLKTKFFGAIKPFSGPYYNTDSK